MDITIRLYWRTDADLIALNLMPNFDLKEAFRASVVAWADGDKDFTISCPPAPTEKGLIIKSGAIHIQFRGEQEQYIIDKIQNIHYGMKGVFIKNLLRGYLDRPFCASYMDTSDETTGDKGQYIIDKHTTLWVPRERGSYKKKKTNASITISSQTGTSTTETEVTVNNEMQTGQTEQQTSGELKSLQQNISDKINEDITENLKDTSLSTPEQQKDTTVSTDNAESAISKPSDIQSVPKNNDETENYDENEEHIDDDFDFWGNIEGVANE